MHAARAARPSRAAPVEQRADGIADDAVKDSSRLLGVHEFHVHGPGMLKGGLDRGGGDFVELQPLGIGNLEDFGEMPGDGFSLSVRVRGEKNLFCLLHRLSNLGDGGAAPCDNDIGGLEGIVNIHPQFLLGEVSDMPHGGEDVEILAQEVAESASLRRRLHYDNGFSLFRLPAHFRHLFPCCRGRY